MPSPASPAQRFQDTRNSTLVSVGANLALTILQLIVGYLGRSQALIADGLHSLSDLLSDFLVLWANRESSRSADASHPYGHARIETASTLVLGVALFVLGAALLWGAGVKLQHPDQLQRVHIATLYIALFTLVAKEALFHYLLAVGKRWRSQMMIANAWHSRSDAASSLVVVAGIGGNLLGYTFLDLVAALIVGFMIVRMGWKMAFDALSDLVDTALDEKEVAAIRATLTSTPGVLGLHELRTRKMGDQALVDAHILVDPHISVSEGHYIAEAARWRVLKNHDVLDVMVHIDPEDDAQAKPSAHLPGRAELIATLRRELPSLPEPGRIVLHYLNGMVEAELYLPHQFWADPARLKCLENEVAAFIPAHTRFRTVQLHTE